MNKLNKNIIRG